ncbi:MAG: DUF192 domain-containing protein [Pseudomonadota bacterium]
MRLLKVRNVFGKAPAVMTAALLIASIANAQIAEEVIIEDGEAAHRFDIELAETDEEISTGLMNRTELATDTGMLFDFGTVRQTSMWMKDTPLPLDMLFLSADGTVVAIARNAVPQSERRIDPGVPVRAVLEINAGLSASLGIKPGSKARHPIFDPTNNGDESVEP